MSNHHHNTPCLSSQEMLDYIQGILSSQEQHRIEKHLLDCEFCSDALEGIQLMENPNSLLAIEEELNSEINSITAEKEEENESKVIVFFPWRMAAAIVLIFISTITLWMVIPKNNTQELISEKSVPYPAPSENSIELKQESQGMQVPNEQAAPPSKSQAPTISTREEQNIDVTAESLPAVNENVSDELFSEAPSSPVKEESDMAKAVSKQEVKVPESDPSTSENKQSGTSLSEVDIEQKKSGVHITTSAARQHDAGASEDSNKDDFDDLYKKGIKEYKNKKYTSAITYLEQCTNKPEAMFYTGVSYFLIDNPHLALSKLEKYIQTNQTSYREASFWYMGLSYLKLDNKSAAKQSFENVLPFKGEFEKQAMEMLKVYNSFSRLAFTLHHEKYSIRSSIFSSHPTLFPNFNKQ
ncbi:MAG: tetratricopeptide repeat protein [Bacteroidetes bacterium]|nr:tetratricopeptide repeat protein [Bacteroidota bacterium]